MRPLKSIHLSITEARAVRAGRRVFDGGVAQGSEHSLDKREVAGSIPASTTKGTCAGGETPAASLSCGGSTMVVHRSAKSKAAGSSPVPRSTSRGRAAVVHTTATSFVRGSSSMVERRPSKSDVAGSSPVSRSVTVCAVSPEWERSGLQPRRLQRQRRFDSVTVLHPLNRPAVLNARLQVCYGDVAQWPRSLRIEGSRHVLQDELDAEESDPQALTGLGTTSPSLIHWQHDGRANGC